MTFIKRPSTEGRTIEVESEERGLNYGHSPGEVHHSPIHRRRDREGPTLTCDVENLSLTRFLFFSHQQPLHHTRKHAVHKAGRACDQHDQNSGRMSLNAITAIIAAMPLFTGSPRCNDHGNSSRANHFTCRLMPRSRQTVATQVCSNS